MTEYIDPEVAIAAECLMEMDGRYAGKVDEARRIAETMLERAFSLTHGGAPVIPGDHWPEVPRS